MRNFSFFLLKFEREKKKKEDISIFTLYENFFSFIKKEEFIISSFVC
jgi:hypothetical protein